LLLWNTLKSPAINLLEVKAPIAANAKRWYLPVFEQAIDGRWVNTQKFSDFAECENFVHLVHLAWLNRPPDVRR
jgi:hypothetical protein